MDHNVGRLLTAFGFWLLFAISCNRIDQQGPSMNSTKPNESFISSSNNVASPERDEVSIQDSIIQAQQDSIRSLLQLLSNRPSLSSQVGDGRYTLQISAWRSKSKAQEIVDTWISRGFTNAYVQEVPDPEASLTWYRVRIGNFETLESAERMKRRLYLDYDVESWVSEIRTNP